MKKTVKTLGELKVGDYVTGSDGKPVQVTAAYDQHLPEAMYELEFDNGFTVEASGNHLWYVESSFDYSLHKRRVCESRKVLRKYLTKDHLDALHDLAQYRDDVVEIGLNDGILDLLGATENVELQTVVLRVASSLGHIAETSHEYQELSTGDHVSYGQVYRMYDAQLLAKQLLALHDKNYAKTHEIRIGSVVTTEDLVNNPEIYHFPSVTDTHQPEVR